MRIAFFCPHSDPLADLGEPDAGGQCVYEARVAEALGADGHTVTCYTRLFGDKPTQQDIAASARVERLRMGDMNFLRKEDMGPYLSEFVGHALSQAGSALARADILHGHYWDGGVAALQTALALGKPLVFTSHSLGLLKRDRLNDEKTFNYRIRIPAEQRVMLAADRIIALSQVEKRALIERYRIPADNINIVPGGVDVAKFAPTGPKKALQAALGITTDYLVLTAGRLDARKGFLEYLSSLPSVVSALEKLGKTVTFMVPQGPPQPNAEESTLRDALFRRAHALGIERHIRFFGRQTDDELRRLYAAADVFACPSLYEPFGLVLVEAMSSGTAVASTNRGGPNDIVTPGHDGFLADPESPEDFAQAILGILSRSEQEQQNLHANALRKANETYSWVAVSEQIAAVYEDVLTSQRSSHRL